MIGQMGHNVAFCLDILLTICLFSHELLLLMLTTKINCDAGPQESNSAMQGLKALKTYFLHQPLTMSDQVLHAVNIRRLLVSHERFLFVFLSMLLAVV